MSDVQPEVPEAQAEVVPTAADQTPEGVPAPVPVPADGERKTDAEMLEENDLGFVGISPQLALKPATNHRAPIAPSE